MKPAQDLMTNKDGRVGRESEQSQLSHSAGTVVTPETEMGDKGRQRGLAPGRCFTGLQTCREGATRTSCRMGTAERVELCRSALQRRLLTLEQCP